MTTGQLFVRAAWRQGRIALEQVRLERPPVARLFTGMTPDKVHTTLPLLYTLCNQAQGRAASAALAAAQDQKPPTGKDQGPWLEALHEHLWRLLLDWPQALGLEVPREAFAVWRKCRHAPEAQFRALTQQLLIHTLGLLDLKTHIPTIRPSSLAARCLEKLGETLPLAEQVEAPASPSAETWLTAWRAGGPDFEKIQATMTAIATPSRPGIAFYQRLQQILVTWQAWCQNQPFPLQEAGASGVGVGITSTARGVLVHGVHLGPQGLIQQYEVWAPTDRLFATPEPLARQLEDCAYKDVRQALQALEVAILALDPCVPYQIDWTED